MSSDRNSGVAIAVSHITKIFGEGRNRVTALDDVSIDIRDNEFFTLLGPSGCGKTTLLRLIAGFDHPGSGTILLHGEDISRLPPFKRSVNTVFQSYALFPHMTVAENIGFGLEMLDRPKAEIRRTVDEMLSLVKMGELKNRRTDQISGGQQQRVALARALAPRPKVLLLDEPLSALDYKLRKDMQIELKRLQHETGITFIFVTHDQEEALTMSDRVAVMNAGRVLQIGSPQAIYNQPADRFVADFIGDTNFLVGQMSLGSEGVRTVRLSGGVELPVSAVEEAPDTGKVTVVIRPEHVALKSQPGDRSLKGRLDTIVYFGTDTHYHITLSTGEPFMARLQNTRGDTRPFEVGQEIGVSIEPDAVQVLRD